MHRYLFLISLFIYCAGVSQQEATLEDNYKNSRVIFAGKVVGYHQEQRGDRLVSYIEFEMLSIYKGERRYKLIVIADDVDNFEVEKFYLIYAVKNKERDSNGKRLGYMHYTVNRQVEIFTDQKNPELGELKTYIKSKFFRRVKKPLPEAKANCRCGL